MGIKFASPLFSLKEEKEAGTGSPDQSPGKIIACLLVLSMIDYLMADYTFVQWGYSERCIDEEICSCCVVSQMSNEGPVGDHTRFYRVSECIATL